MVAAEELSIIKMSTGNQRKYKKVIGQDGNVAEWVGIGWVAVGKPTRHQRRHLHHVQDTRVGRTT